MLIKEHDLEESTVLEIGKFAILWNWFEHSWCNNNCNSQVIRRIAKTIPINKEKLNQLANVLNERCSWSCQLKTDYILISLHPQNSRMSSKNDIETMLQFMEQTGEDLNCGCLLVLNRIRNNLMHGIKRIEDLNGQIELFKAANDVLESIGK